MKTIFVLDDAAGALKIYESFINTKFNHNLITETNPLNAHDIIKNNSIDLAFFDIMMPQKNGIDLLKEVRDKGYEFPIIIMTASHSLKTTITALKEGAYDYIKKPVDLEQVGRIITELIGEGKEEVVAEVEESLEDLLVDGDSDDILVDFGLDEEMTEEEKQEDVSDELEGISKDELFSIGYNYFKRNDYEKARLFWEKLLESDPENKTVKYNLEILEKKEKKGTAKSKFHISF